MTDQLTQQKINATAWAACDTVRGAMDPAQYKEQYCGNDERIRGRLQRERFVLPKSKGNCA